MDHDDATIGKIYTRREALAIAGKAGLVFASTGSVFSSFATRPQTSPTRVHLVAAPSLTEGPFYVNEGLNRSNLLADCKRPSVTGGVPFRLDLTFYAGATKDDFSPLPGAKIDIWHTDALGVYSDEPQGLNAEDTEGQHWLRGYQVTDHRGLVSFQTIFPGWYRGRTSHIHFKCRYLRDGKTPATFTSQLFFQDEFADQVYKKSPYIARSENDMRNMWDQVYSEKLPDGTASGEILTLRPQAARSGSGLVAQFSVALVTHPHPSQGNGTSLFDRGR